MASEKTRRVRKMEAPIAVFERIAKSSPGVSVKDLDMDRLYGEQTMGRWKRAQASARQAAKRK